MSSAHAEYRHQAETDRLVWDLARRDQIWITHGKGKPGFAFATDGVVAEVKCDADCFSGSSLDNILGIMAQHPCVLWAEAIVPIPNGMIGNTREIGDLAGKEVIEMYRPEGASSRYDIRFRTRTAKLVAQAIQRVTLLEDLSSTGTTAHEQAKILREANPELEIHTISMMERAEPRLAYQKGEGAIEYHTLCRAPKRPVPIGYDDFVAAYGFEPRVVPYVPKR